MSEVPVEVLVHRLLAEQGVEESETALLALESESVVEELVGMRTGSVEVGSSQYKYL